MVADMLKKREDYWYGDEQADIRPELLRYSKLSGYVIDHFADAICRCGAKIFRLMLDDSRGAAVRTCVKCDSSHPIGDSEQYLHSADLEDLSCLCEEEEFEICLGVSLYEESNDVRWIYIGCRCPKCGLTGCYGDWKNEYVGYQKLLSLV